MQLHVCLKMLRINWQLQSWKSLLLMSVGTSSWPLRIQPLNAWRKRHLMNTVPDARRNSIPVRFEVENNKAVSRGLQQTSARYSASCS